MTRAQLLIAEASKWIGVKEEGGDNKGETVEMFQRAVDGRAFQESWCASFAFYCLINTGGTDLFMSEHCLTVWNRSPKELRRQKPEPGCLVVWQFEGTASGHMGIVKMVLSDTQILTIEGNTSGASHIERNGGGVYLKQRASRPVTGRMKLVGFLWPWRAGPETAGPAF
jgi:uncharacterized protein (TIGR02594 family)